MVDALGQRALVWFKRDLRVHEHAALVAAQSHVDAFALFVIEPEWLQSPECDVSHVDFALACLTELRAALAQRGMPLLVRVGSCVQVLAQLHTELGFAHLLSHEETGPGWSYTRDLAVAAWCEGRTGYPMVDACMRSLIATGWLNFRMRAMLVSFSSYHLWLHWRPTGMFLARQFLDYEPGIHWRQMQMQCGTTGINTLRMYSPTKQAQDQDPLGVFIRRWAPELAKVPLPYLAEPWKMNASVQHMAGCMIGADYPAPIVIEKTAMKAAKDRMYGLRQTDEARGRRIHNTVTARRSFRLIHGPYSE